MSDLPGSVLFACSMNAIRSPMAEGFLKFLHGTRIYVDSVGTRKREVDGFAIAVMEEMGIDISRHAAKTFDDLQDDLFDIVVTLSPEAHHRALELTRTSPVEVEFWNTFDPSLVEGSREQRLDAYRQVRDRLFERIRDRFAPQMKP
ncbi:MAG: low molecular weight phosphatase family protein [Rhodospirillaceae bacterium]|nr:low molecular weight phosphatase family protein [Rhodospirillaceae bacterium]MYH37258.1 low molecular weight phosphatase family protein [Rhodospirillaceae bacterium]MYK14903.1 low molecular weight phosphatase family protein [Rhodospirillaceae bacterium]